MPEDQPAIDAKAAIAMTIRFAQADALRRQALTLSRMARELGSADASPLPTGATSRLGAAATACMTQRMLDVFA